MKDAMPRFDFQHSAPDAHIALFIVMIVMMLAFICLLLLQGQADREQAERFSDPYKYLDRAVKLRLMEKDPERYGERFRDVE